METVGRNPLPQLRYLTRRKLLQTVWPETGAEESLLGLWSYISRPRKLLMGKSASPSPGGNLPGRHVGSLSNTEDTQVASPMRNFILRNSKENVFILLLWPYFWTILNGNSASASPKVATARGGSCCRRKTPRGAVSCDVLPVGLQGHVLLLQMLVQRLAAGHTAEDEDAPWQHSITDLVHQLHLRRGKNAYKMHPI